MRRNGNVSGAPLAGDAILKSFRLVSNSPSWSLDRMRESWLQNFSDLKSSRITVSEWRRRSKELDNSMEVIKKAIREEKRSRAQS